jgi:hypothetical protein
LVELFLVNLHAVGAGSAAVVNASAAVAFIVLALFLAGRAWQGRTQSP